MTIQTGTRFNHALKSDLLHFSGRLEYTFNAFIHYLVELRNPRRSNFVFTRKVPLAFGLFERWHQLVSSVGSVKYLVRVSSDTVFFIKIFLHASRAHFKAS